MIGHEHDDDPRSDREILHSIERIASENMATSEEVLTAVNTLKTDLTTKFEAIQTEFTKIAAELPNPEVLDQALTGINEATSTVNAFTIPTT
jgi:hypothetical protein